MIGIPRGPRARAGPHRRAAAARAGLTEGISAHSLRAGFVTFAHLRGASDRAIAHQTRHRSLATLGTYVRVQHGYDRDTPETRRKALLALVSGR